MANERIGILIGPKGRGSNMAAIIRACQSGTVSASIDVVIAPKADIPPVQEASQLGVRAVVIPPDEPGYEDRLLNALSQSDLVCLAGYLRLLPEAVLEAFPGRILNVHPALLPKFGGKGMYGMRVHEAVLEAGEKVSGATVHLVTAKYDEGEIIAQRTCPVFPTDTPEALAERVLVEEHLAYVEALRKFLA